MRRKIFISPPSTAFIYAGGMRSMSARCYYIFAAIRYFRRHIPCAAFAASYRRHESQRVKITRFDAITIRRRQGEHDDDAGAPTISRLFLFLAIFALMIMRHATADLFSRRAYFQMMRHNTDFLLTPQDAHYFLNAMTFGARDMQIFSIHTLHACH